MHIFRAMSIPPKAMYLLELSLSHLLHLAPSPWWVLILRRLHVVGRTLLHLWQQLLLRELSPQHMCERHFCKPSWCWMKFPSRKRFDFRRLKHVKASVFCFSKFYTLLPSLYIPQNPPFFIKYYIESLTNMCSSEAFGFNWGLWYSRHLLLLPPFAVFVHENKFQTTFLLFYPFVFLNMQVLWLSSFAITSEPFLF